MTTRVDSVMVYYVVNEAWLVNGAPLADVTGEVLADGSIHIADGFAYYIETTVTKTVTGKDGKTNTTTDETVATSPIYRDTWLMVANGKHEFVNVSNSTTNSGTVTPEAITWGLTTPTDNVQTWGGWRDNRLYFTDGSKFVIPGTEPQGMQGDVNKDGSVSIADVTTLINALLTGEYADSDTFSFANSDCNKDGSISIADVTVLINYLLTGSW